MPGARLLRLLHLLLAVLAGVALLGAPLASFSTACRDPGFFGNLRGDITSGSSRTIRWDIKKQDDVIAKGKTYGFSPTPTYNNTSEPYHNQGASITINRGTVQIQSTPSTANSNIA